VRGGERRGTMHGGDSWRRAAVAAEEEADVGAATEETSIDGDGGDRSRVAA
jgi:hypothetical protein